APFAFDRRDVRFQWAKVKVRESVRTVLGFVSSDHWVGRRMEDPDWDSQPRLQSAGRESELWGFDTKYGALRGLRPYDSTASAEMRDLIIQSCTPSPHLRRCIYQGFTGTFQLSHDGKMYDGALMRGCPSGPWTVTSSGGASDQVKSDVHKLEF